MATPITSIDSPNVVSTVNNITLNVSGGLVAQDDFSYVLANRYEFTGSVIDGNTVGFGYGMLPVPTGSFMTYSFGGQTTQADFDFAVNGIKVIDFEVIGLNENLTNTETTLSLQLPYDLIASDIVTGKGRWNV